MDGQTDSHKCYTDGLTDLHDCQMNDPTDSESYRDRQRAHILTRSMLDRLTDAFTKAVDGQTNSKECWTDRHLQTETEKLKRMLNRYVDSQECLRDRHTRVLKLTKIKN